MIRLLISITFLSLSFVDSFYLLLGEKDSDRSMRSLLDRDFSKGKKGIPYNFRKSEVYSRMVESRGHETFSGKFSGSQVGVRTKNDPIGSTA